MRAVFDPEIKATKKKATTKAPAGPSPADIAQLLAEREVTNPGSTGNATSAVAGRAISAIRGPTKPGGKPRDNSAIVKKGWLKRKGGSGVAAQTPAQKAAAAKLAQDTHNQVMRDAVSAGQMRNADRQQTNRDQAAKDAHQKNTQAQLDGYMKAAAASSKSTAKDAIAVSQHTNQLALQQKAQEEAARRAAVVQKVTRMAVPPRDMTSQVGDPRRFSALAKVVQLPDASPDEWANWAYEGVLLGSVDPTEVAKQLDPAAKSKFTDQLKTVQAPSEAQFNSLTAKVTAGRASHADTVEALAQGIATGKLDTKKVPAALAQEVSNRLDALNRLEAAVKQFTDSSTTEGKGYTKGGYVDPTGLHLVGEQGPEFFQPHGKANVLWEDPEADVDALLAKAEELAEFKAKGGADQNRGGAETLRHYWLYGPGAAKIRWGTPGDWTRCYHHLSKYLGERAKGYCNLRHKDANGFYPGDKRNKSFRYNVRTNHKDVWTPASRLPFQAKHLKGDGDNDGVANEGHHGNGHRGLPMPKYADFAKMQKIDGPLGSNGGQWYRDGTREFLVKPTKDPDSAWNEVAAGEVYRQMGVEFPNTGIVTNGGRMFLVSERIHGLKPISQHQWSNNPALQAQAAAHFGTDAWLSHWDVLGLVADNTLVGKDGRPVRIESGGAMAFRAMGGSKPSFNPKADWVEPSSMRTSTQGKVMYGRMSDAQVAESLNRVARVDVSTIRSAWDRIGVPGHLADSWEATLRARQKQIPGLIAKLHPEVKRLKGDGDNDGIANEGHHGNGRRGVRVQRAVRPRLHVGGGVDLRPRAKPKPVPKEEAAVTARLQHVQDLMKSDEWRTNGPHDSLVQNTNPHTGFLTTERQIIHAQMIEKAITDAEARGVPNGHEMIMMGGLGGAGKSSILRDHAKAAKFGVKLDAGNDADHPLSHLIVNADLFKEELIKRHLVDTMPGMTPLESAHIAHEESGQLADSLARVAAMRGMNVIIDGTMGGEGSAHDRVSLFRGQGYKTTGVFVDVDQNKSKASAHSRYAAGLKQFAIGQGIGGRPVPDAFIDATKPDKDVKVPHAGKMVKARSKNRIVFQHMADDGSFDKAFVFDNQGKTNTDYPGTLVWQK